MTPTDQLAWRIYCEYSKGAMSARDHWDDLCERDKEFYRKEALTIQFLSKQVADTVEELLLQDLIKQRR